MQYRALGHSGLRVSAIAYGAWLTVSESGSAPLAHLEILRRALQGGVNFIDNAESYGAEVGESEELMGQALRRLFAEGLQRSELVVATKIFQGGEAVNQRGLSRKHLVEGLRASLQRLQLDYVPRHVGFHDLASLGGPGLLPSPRRDNAHGRDGESYESFAGSRHLRVRFAKCFKCFKPCSGLRFAGLLFALLSEALVEVQNLID